MSSIPEFVIRHSTNFQRQFRWIEKIKKNKKSNLFNYLTKTTSSIKLHLYINTFP